MAFLVYKVITGVIAAQLLTICMTADIKSDCYEPKCFIMSSTSRIIQVDTDSGTVNSTTFCFTGLKKAVFNLWANPFLKITRKDAKTSFKFTTYYGTSLSDVDFRSKQPGYAILQKILSSSRYYKETEDFSFSPFNDSCYLIESDVSYKAGFRLKVADIWYLAYMVIGAVIFFSAKSWSHNTTLHYGSGVSIGMLASLLILVFILSRLLPSKLKSFGYLLMLLGTSASLWILQTFTSYFNEPLTGTLIENWQYFAGYFTISGVISFAVVYRYGPITDGRTLNLIQWFLQFVGLLIVYNSTQIREVSIAVVLVLIVIYYFPTSFFWNQRCQNLWLRMFPPKIKLLSEDEYIRQGEVETLKELEKLRQYCQSPECQTWKVISKLKSPHRFAGFIMQGAWHISDEEMTNYENCKDPTCSDNDDTDSELVFVLGSLSRTVRA